MSYKKIVVISDTHGFSFADKIPECDILLICGDISPVNADHSFYFQKQWFHDTFIKDLKSYKEKAKHIVFIGGNHDTYLSEINITDGHGNRINNYLPDNVHYLCNESIIIDDIKIYGSPWVCLPNWARSGPPVWNFAKKDENLLEVYSSIPKDVDIIMTHGPAHRFCDVILDEGVIDFNIKNFNYKPDNLGSKSLTSILNSKNIKPKYVFSGHIHSADHNVNKILDKDLNVVTKFYCTSLLDESYQFAYNPLVIKYEH